MSPAQAQILRHVRDALAWPPHGVYEEDNVTTNTGPDGTTHTVEYHKWVATSPPYNSRETVIVNHQVLWEQAFVNGQRDLYDPTTDTIYLQPGDASKGVVGCTRCSSDTPQSNSALSEVQDLLNGPRVTINRHAVLNGRPAMQLTFDRGRFSYWISPRTYQPLQVKDRYFPGDRSLPDRAGAHRSRRVPPGSFRCKPSIPTRPSITAPPITTRPIGWLASGRRRPGADLTKNGWPRADTLPAAVQHTANPRFR